MTKLWRLHVAAGRTVKILYTLVGRPEQMESHAVSVVSLGGSVRALSAFVTSLRSLTESLRRVHPALLVLLVELARCERPESRSH